MQRPHRHVHADDLGEPRVLEQRLHQLALPAAQVEHPRARRLRAAPRGSRPGAARRAAPASPRCPSSSSTALSIVLDLAVVGLGEPHQFQALHGLPGQRPAARQIAAGDQLLLRVVGEPALAGAQQLVDLVGRDPVVLGVVEHRQQDVQMPQRVGQPQLALQDERARTASRPTPGTARPAAPARPRRSSRAARTAAAPARRRRGRAARAPRCAAAAYGSGQLGPRLARGPSSRSRTRCCSATASSEDAAYGRSLTYCASAASGAPPRPLPLPRRTSATGIHLQQQRRGAALGGRLGVEDVRVAVRGGERLRLRRDACAAGSRGRSPDRRRFPWW